VASDLIERLRRDTSTPYGCQNCNGDEREEAADEIARLTAEIARLREALTYLMEKFEGVDEDARYIEQELEATRRIAALNERGQGG
jgi:predicted  nucleic acid-binding Zn-ribbon protein